MKVFCLLLLTWTTVGCTHRTESQPYPPDHELFPLVIKALSDSTTGELRVDPRPLNPDPRLVVLEQSLADVAPTAVTSPNGPLLEVDEALIKRRTEVLATLGVLIGDALSDNLCSGAMVAPSPGTDHAKKTNCPPTEYRSAVVALPRQGGVFWPGNVDERDRNDGDVWSVRVITQDVGPTGKVAVTIDYVFIRKGTWRLVEARPLFILE